MNSFPLVFVQLALSLNASPVVAAHTADPIRLPLSFIQSNAVTTIRVGGETIHATVDTGGDVDGVLTLSKEVIERAGGVGLGNVVTNDVSGREFARPLFRVPVATMGGRTFQDVKVIQARTYEAGEGPAVPNAIGRKFLSQYFVVVDYPGASITLWPPATRNPTGIHCGHTRIRMERTAEARLAVSVFDMPSGRVRLAWDTGATYSMLAQTTAEKLQLETKVRDPSSPKFHQAKTLSAAGQDVGPLEFVVLPLGISTDFDGLLGLNFFNEHVVCIDYAHREIRVH